MANAYVANKYFILYCNPAASQACIDAFHLSYFFLEMPDFYCYAGFYFLFSSTDVVGGIV